MEKVHINRIDFYFILGKVEIGHHVKCSVILGYFMNLKIEAAKARFLMGLELGDHLDKVMIELFLKSPKMTAPLKYMTKCTKVKIILAVNEEGQKGNK